MVLGLYIGFEPDDMEEDTPDDGPLPLPLPVELLVLVLVAAYGEPEPPRAEEGDSMIPPIVLSGELE